MCCCRTPYLLRLSALTPSQVHAFILPPNSTIAHTALSTLIDLTAQDPATLSRTLGTEVVSSSPPTLSCVPVPASITPSPSSPEAPTGADSSSTAVVLGAIFGGVSALVMIGIVVAVVCRKTRVRSADRLQKYLGSDNVSLITNERITYGAHDGAMDSALSKESPRNEHPPLSVGDGDARGRAISGHV